MLAIADGWNYCFAKCTFDMYDGDEYLTFHLKEFRWQGKNWKRQNLISCNFLNLRNEFKHKKCRYDKQRNLCDEIITRQQKLIEGKTYFTKTEKEEIVLLYETCMHLFIMFKTSNRLHHLI